MQLEFRVLIAVAVIYASGLAVRAATKVRFRFAGHIIVDVAAIGMGFAAMLIPRTAPITRALVAVIGILVGARAFSYLRESLGRPDGGWIGYLRFLSIGLLRPHLVWSPDLLRRGPRPAVSREIVRLVGGIGVALLGCLIGRELVLTAVAERSWWLNHLIVAIAFGVVMQANGQTLLAVWRLLRVPRVRGPLADGIFLSRTPADFWRRWNWPPLVWLYRYIYQYWGGRRHHTRATWAAFAASGIGHELLVFAAIGRPGGQQMIFFLLNGAAVLLSPPLERLANRSRPGDALARLITLSFLIVSAALMFATFDQVFPLYHRRSWLEW